MGIAEAIPGVSGGTIAFITGIYERLLTSIKAIDPSLISIFRSNGVSGVWDELNGKFLLFVIGGMIVGLGGGAFGITYLLEAYPSVVWAFFFGLIISSVIYIGGKIDRWTPLIIISGVIGAAVAYYITIATPAQGLDSPIFIFLTGFIAISALILPGISGSFIMLLMGMYTLIMSSIKGILSFQIADNIKVCFFFGLGALSGLAVFSRVLTWMFKNYEQLTLAVLTGFMLGSLNKIWPWRNVLSTRTNSSGEEVPFREVSVMPGYYEGDVMMIGVVLSVITGFMLVWVLSRFDKGSQTE